MDRIVSRRRQNAESANDMLIAEIGHFVIDSSASRTSRKNAEG
jgi:hypothetical protein